MAPLQRGPTVNVSPVRAGLLFLALATVVVLAGCDLLDRGKGGGTRRAYFDDSFVAAKVNGRPITNEDVRAFAVSERMIRDGDELDTDSDIFHVALQDLITQRLFAMDAESRGLDRDPDVRRQIETAREVILSRAIMAEIEARATNPATVERLYRENARHLGRTQEAHLRAIQFETREAALAAKRRLDEGERFEALAFELSRDRQTGSEGGDWGWREVDNLPDGIRQTAETSRIGETAGPIQSEIGWHLLRVEDRRQKGAPSLASIREQIINWQRFQETNRLREKLETTARIEIAAERPAGAAAPAESEAPADQPEPRAAAPRRPRPSVANPFDIPMGPGGVAGSAGAEPAEPAPPEPETETTSADERET